MSSSTYDEDLFQDPFFQALVELAGEEVARAAWEDPAELTTPDLTFGEEYVPTFLPVDMVRKMEETRRWPEEYRGSSPASLARTDIFTLDWFDGNRADHFARIKGADEPFKAIAGRETRLPGEKWAPWQPFGDFKKLGRLSRAKIYESFCETWMKPCRPGAKSPLELFLEHYPRIHRLNLGGFLSTEDVMVILSYRVWRSTFGTRGEGIIHELLHEMAKKDSRLSYQEGSEDEETSGVDGILTITREDGARSRRLIGIKCGNAFSDDYIRIERGKGKHRPTHYVGLMNPSRKGLTYHDLEWKEAKRFDE